MQTFIKRSQCFVFLIGFIFQSGFACFNLILFFAICYGQNKMQNIYAGRT